MIEIPLFNKEIEANIGDLVRNNYSINYISLLEPAESFDLNEINEKFIQSLKASEGEEEVPFDLEFKKSVLVSTIWNKNDDYFEPLEVWPARYTAKDKPFNIEHESEVIIGHMIGSYPVDDEGKIIPDNVSMDDLPKKYHIVSKNVIYKWWRKKEKREEIQTLLEEIAAGEWYVSVESLFSNFDYALLDKNNNLKIVCRTKDTAFLTKHLRIYGGSGVYQNFRIGRVPRNITFSGIGLVRKPANPESVLFAKKYDFNSIISDDLVYLQSNNIGEQMDEKLKIELETKIAELTSNLETALSNLKIKSDETVSLTEQKVKLENDLAVALSAIEQNKKEIDSVQKIKDELEKKFSDAVKESAIASEELSKLKLEKVQTARLSLVSSKLSVDNEKAKKLIEDLVSFDDEKFNSHIEMLASFKSEKINSDILDKIEEEKKKEDKTEPSLSLNHNNGVDNNVLESISKFVEASRK